MTLPFFEVSEKEFFMEVNEVARYFVRNGNEILIQPIERSDPDSVRLFLIGSAFGAILHQKCLLPLHGSSFNYKGKGIVICGASGAGKSSVVAAFCQKEGIFINDDITPIQIAEDQATIIPIKSRLKLWDDTLEKLNITNNRIERIRPEMDKFYQEVENSCEIPQRLHEIYILHSHQKNEFSSTELTGFEKYNALRHQIYRKIYLKGMPETEKAYFKQLLKLSPGVKVKLINRPNICSIIDTMEFIEKEIGR